MKLPEHKVLYEQATKNILAQLKALNLSPEKHKRAADLVFKFREAFTKDEVKKLAEGVVIDEIYTTKPAKEKSLKTDVEKNISRLEIKIHEGKNRQVRKMCEAIGRKVLALHRSKIGNIEVRDMKIGTWRFLNKKEVEEILN